MIAPTRRDNRQYERRSRDDDVGLEIGLAGEGDESLLEIPQQLVDERRRPNLCEGMRAGVLVARLSRYRVDHDGERQTLLPIQTQFQRRARTSDQR